MELGEETQHRKATGVHKIWLPHHVRTMVDNDIYNTHMTELNAWEQGSVMLGGYERARFAEKLWEGKKKV